MSITSVLEIFGAICTALGGYEGIKWLVGFFAHRREEKRLKGAEANKAEAEADQSAVATEKALRDMYEETLGEMRVEFTERINELHASLTNMNERNHELLKAGARKDDIINDKTTKIRELQDELLASTKENGQLEKRLLFYKNWHCRRELGDGKDDCRRREPAQNPPLKYEPIE